MTPQEQPTERDLIALADGSLPATRRARVERAVADSPELQANLAAQRRALLAIHRAADEPAPAALRARLALARAPRRRQLAPQRRLATFTSAALAAAAMVLVAVLAISGSATGVPTVAQAATLAVRPPVAPVPARHGNSVTLPRLRAAGLPYPYWEDHFGYRATGLRHDRLAGRQATTVYYMRGDRRVAYTIISGPALPIGARAHSTLGNDIPLRTLSAHGRLIVTWLRRGHTCVVTATDTALPVLLRLASWRGGGEIPY